MPLLSSILSQDICTTDGDGVEPHCTTSGDTQGNHVARQLLTVRAAAEILTAIVDADDKCGSSLSKSKTQVTGPSYFANQIERHVEASQGFSDQLTNKFPVLDQGLYHICKIFCLLHLAYGVLHLSCHTKGVHNTVLQGMKRPAPAPAIVCTCNSDLAAANPQ